VIKTDSEKILNPQNVAERLDSFFIDDKEDRLAQNKPYKNGQISQIKIKYNFNPICVSNNRRPIK
jgi:hypothetical protein